MNAIALTLWTTFERSETEATEPRDWLQQAINRPARRLAEFWLESLSLWRKQHIEDISGQMREEYKQALTVIVSDDSITGGLGRTILTSRLGFLLASDEQWTTKHLVPLFSDDNDTRFQQAWDGFLTCGRLTPQIEAILTPVFLSALPRLDSVLMARRDRFVQYYTTSAGPIPLEHVEVPCMLDWLPHLPATFPEAVMLAVRMPKARFEYSHLTYALKDSPLVEQYPDEIARLIIFVLSCDVPTSTWHGLQELAGRLAPLPVQEALIQALIERLVERGFDISVFG